MPIDYLPILILMVITVVFCTLALLIGRFVGPHRPTPAKLSPYECGVPPIGSARRRMAVKFYLTAVLFILFDIELVFLYPWAVVFKALKLFGFVEMLIFILVLVVGYVYVWRKGGFEWE